MGEENKSLTVYYFIMLSLMDVSPNEPRVSRRPDDLMRGRIEMITPTKTGVYMGISDEKCLFSYALIDIEGEPRLNVGDEVTVEFYNFDGIRYLFFNKFRDNRLDAQAIEVIYKSDMQNLGDILSTKGKALIRCKYSEYV